MGANSFSSFYCCELTRSFSSGAVTTILVGRKEGRKEVSCLSAGGDNALQRLTNLEEEPGVAAAVAGRRRVGTCDPPPTPLIHNN